MVAKNSVIIWQNPDYDYSNYNPHPDSVKQTVIITATGITTRVARITHQSSPPYVLSAVAIVAAAAAAVIIIVIHKKKYNENNEP